MSSIVTDVSDNGVDQTVWHQEQNLWQKYEFRWFIWEVTSGSCVEKWQVTWDIFLLDPTKNKTMGKIAIKVFNHLFSVSVFT